MSKKLVGVAPVRGCDERPEETSIARVNMNMSSSCCESSKGSSPALVVNNVDLSSSCCENSKGSLPALVNNVDSSSSSCENSKESPPTLVNKVDKYCWFCGDVCVEVLKCEGCNCGCYCSSRCRDVHVSLKDHQELCVPIQQLDAVMTRPGPLMIMLQQISV